MRQVALGAQHMLVLLDSGVVFACGDNAHGQLGVGRAVAAQATPTLVTELLSHHIVQVAAGRLHSLARDDAGRVFAWGDNAAGECGLGDVAASCVWIPAGVGLAGGGQRRCRAWRASWWRRAAGSRCS